MKDTYIQVRISTEEKNKILELSKSMGFDSLSQFLLWYIRRLYTLKEKGSL